ncbi:MAG: cysteine desulfurase [Candidatus Bathyarchaeota archaeon]|nr:cysteine desulfurase [Candidatus Bathyarchaeota archaeon]MDH5791872.1 cysteine desulfurase [Candidatus Bathyarchaeota archaeon]
MLDVEAVRRDFPILEKGVVYLDSAASSLTPEQVVLKEMEFYREYRANVERGVHRFSQRASEEYEGAHEIVAGFIGAPSAENVAMLRNTTEGLNLVANSLDWRKGDKIVTTVIEHHSNFITWLRVGQRHGCRVEVVRSDPEGRFDMADFERAIDYSTRLVAVTRVSNVLGCIVPVKEVAKIAHERGALVVEDGAQGVPHLLTDVSDTGVDFLAFSGHKMLGPTGSGGLYFADDVLYRTEPLSIGGGTISDVSIDSYELAVPPLRFEAGTPAIAQVIGLGEACRYLERIGMDEVARWDARHAERLSDGLREIEGVEVYGPSDPRDRVGIVSFNVGDMSPHDVALSLDEEHAIAVRSGHHCALPLMKELFRLPEGTVRASTYVYNTVDEIELLLGAVEDLARG